jgi:Ala-tRNA(Pro) deacylase
MAILSRLQEFLDREGVDYEVLNHPQVFTAQQVAEKEHVPGKAFAKVVMVKTEEKFVMTVLPAPDHLNLRRLSHVLGNAARLAVEEEFAPLFPGCEPGAMPAFGSFFGIETLVEQALTLQSHIAFNAGNHAQSIRMRTQDFLRLAHPRVAAFSNRVEIPAQHDQRPGDEG